jgi:hypothetical protein
MVEWRGPRVYYYRTRKVAGRPVRVYIAAGTAAEVAAAEDTQKRRGVGR